MVPCHELHPQFGCMSSGHSQELGITSLSAAWERPAKAPLLPGAAARLWSALQNSPGDRADLHQQGKKMDVCQPNPQDQSCHIRWDAQRLSCWQLLPPDGPGMAPGWRWLTDSLCLWGEALRWHHCPEITALLVAKKSKQRVMQCGKNLLLCPEAKSLGIRSPDKKAKEAFEPRKGLNGLTGSKEKPGRNKEKNILSWSLQLTVIQEGRNISYNELGKIFFECVKGKIYIVHAYFMLSNTPVWERNSHTDFCILKEKETGSVGRLLQSPITGRRNSSFGLLCQWSFSAMQYLGKGCLYHGHVTQEPQNFPNPDLSCSVTCANGCNISSFSVPLIISLFLEYQ